MASLNGIHTSVANSVTGIMMGAVVDRTRPPPSTEDRTLSSSSIDDDLPILAWPDSADLKTGTYTAVKPSSMSTANQDPPSGWSEEKATADRSLTKYFSHVDGIKVGIQAPQSDDSHYLSNEADVVRAAILYLLHPVNLAAQAWLKKKNSQFTLKCTSETSPKGTDEPLRTRTDIEWKLFPCNENEAIAVLEFKRKHTLNPQKINKAKIEKPRDQGFTKDTAEEAIVKQVTHYIANHFSPKVDDACVFDWDTLWILNYEDWDKSNPTAGIPKGLLHQEKGDIKWGSKPQYTFRQLLLAFLIRAMSRKLGPPSAGEPAGDSVEKSSSQPTGKRQTSGENITTDSTKRSKTTPSETAASTSTGKPAAPSAASGKPAASPAPPGKRAAPPAASGKPAASPAASGKPPTKPGPKKG